MRSNSTQVSCLLLSALAFLSLTGQSVAQRSRANSQFNIPGASHCQPFIPATTYLANSSAGRFVPGDFNGDGIVDFAVYQSGSSVTVTVLLGKKDGTFLTGQTYAIGSSGHNGITVGDFNGDGKLDIAAAADSSIEILLGKGDGTFRSGKTTAAQFVSAMAVGDFNQDGKLDLVVTESSNTTGFLMMLGNGDGTFQSPLIEPATNAPDAIAVADFNHDGHLDIAVANGFGASVSVLLGSGDGTFRPKTDYRVGSEPFGLTTADFDGDGFMDLATADYVSGTASVLINKGDGTFLPAVAYSTGRRDAPYRIAAGPLSAGSKPSLAVATIGGTSVLVNDGNGTFKNAQGYEPVSTEVLLEDFDGDGNTDLAVAGGLIGAGGSGGVTIIKGKGNGSFAAPSASFAAFNLLSVTTADFDGDGKQDLAAIGEEGGFSILHGHGDGIFSAPVFHQNFPTVGHGGQTEIAVASGDFNRDGNPDLAIVTDYDTAGFKLVIFLGNGKGGFSLLQGYSVPSGPQQIALADFNGDGILDIAASGNGEVYILIGNGDGTFQSKPNLPAAGTFNGLAISDFNRDGKLDLAVSNPDSSSVTIYLGHGDGTFKNGATYAMTFKPSAIAAADFNGDGKMDLAVGEGPRQGSGEMQILRGVGDGTFQVGSTFIGGYAPVAADFDGDGSVDLATLNSRGLLQLMFGNGDGTFAAGSISSVGQGANAFVSADLNGDGNPDLAIPNYWGGEVSVLLNQCGTP